MNNGRNKHHKQNKNQEGEEEEKINTPNPKTFKWDRCRRQRRLASIFKIVHYSEMREWAAVE